MKIAESNKTADSPGCGESTALVISRSN